MPIVFHEYLNISSIDIDLLFQSNAGPLKRETNLRVHFMLHQNPGTEAPSGQERYRKSKILRLSEHRASGPRSDWTMTISHRLTKTSAIDTTVFRTESLLQVVYDGAPQESGD